MLKTGGVPLTFHFLERRPSQGYSLEAMMNPENLTLAQSAADVAHDLNNPIGGVIGLTQLLLEGGKLGPKERQDVETILAQGQCCRAIIQDLLLFRPRAQPKKEKIDLSPIVHSIVESLRYDFVKIGLKLVDKCPPSLPFVLGDAGQLQQVFLHFALHVRRAIAGQKEKKLFLEGGQNANHIYVRLRYSGRALSEDLYKTDFRWLVCRQILQDHEGSLSVQKTESPEASLTMTLPHV
jgi:signal transduction histidine kinase